MPDVYVARRRLRVGARVVLPGDEVPEANSWRNLPVYVHNGSLALVQTDVQYARGNQQRRPLAPDRADYRVHRDHWRGEVRYGGGPDQPNQLLPTITSATPTSYPVANSGVSPALVLDFQITGTNLAGSELGLSDDRFLDMCQAGVTVDTQTNTAASGQFHTSIELSSYQRLPVTGQITATKQDVGWSGFPVMLEQG